MATTSNGRPWGENTGRVGSGILYGWMAMRGIKAAQRRPPQPDDSAWSAPAHAARVSVAWFFYVALLVINSFSITNGAVMIVASFLDKTMGGGPMKGMLTLLTAVPAMWFSYACISAARALVARIELLPPTRGEKYLALSWFPQKGWKLWLYPALTYIPFGYVQSVFS